MDKKVFDELIKIDLKKIDFKDAEQIKDTIVRLFNVIEGVCAENKRLKEENQELKDEINRLKGENGKPDIKANNTNDKGKVPKLSELGKEKKKWKKRRKKEHVKIDREEVIKIDKSKLPKDAEFKGYHTQTIQNIQLKTDNVLYKLESYYSPSEGKTYTAEMPEHLKNTEYGVEVKALIYMLYFECRVTEPKIAEILNSSGVQISEGTVSNIIIKEKATEFTAEKKEIFEAALSSSAYHQIDDTGIRVNGKNGYATVLCNESYAAYFIRRYKNRETVNKIICNVDEDADIDVEELKTLIETLIADDAPQFKKLTKRLGLCWVHEERHYGKMVPVLQYHKELLEKVIGEIWDYYRELQAYKKDPKETDKERLSNRFDEIFTQKTGYDLLDERLTLTHGKKEYLLLVLDHPEIPLTNNLSELTARTIVTKRKISFGVRNKTGKTAWENGLTILSTCKKHAVNFYSYVKDIFAGCSNRVRLSELILEKNLGKKHSEIIDLEAAGF